VTLLRLDVLEERIAYIIRAEGMNELGTRRMAL
jgi:hypothetical protein